jgi:DNA primase large subunit
MQNLHRDLRRDAHLKHYGRLQYTLFLKGIGLNLEEALVFWRTSFNKITDDVFNKEYRYNVRHAYGDVGGDSNRRGNGYSPFSCQKILTEHPPGPGESHGCPYRHFSLDNLTSLLQTIGIKDQEVLRGVKEDKEKQKFHLACNRYVLLYHILHSSYHTDSMNQSIRLRPQTRNQESERRRNMGSCAIRDNRSSKRVFQT